MTPREDDLKLPKVMVIVNRLDKDVGPPKTMTYSGDPKDLPADLAEWTRKAVKAVLKEEEPE